MSCSLIINARHRLRWHQRLCSDASTVLMWGAWLKLWYPMLRSSAWVADLGVLASSAGDVQRYAVALAGTSGTLFLWNQLPASKVEPPAEQSLGDYARHFELSEDEIEAGRGTSVAVVHHDDHGRIIRVERRPAGGAQA